MTTKEVQNPKLDTLYYFESSNYYTSKDDYYYVGKIEKVKMDNINGEIYVFRIIGQSVVYSYEKHNRNVWFNAVHDMWEHFSIFDEVDKYRYISTIPYFYKLEDKQKKSILSVIDESIAKKNHRLEMMQAIREMING